MSADIARRSSGRILALDFTKGVLVLLMVLYHWLNYFFNTEYVYRYLRFLTPSFIFITGFLISQVYLSRYDINNQRLWRRLLARGTKILAIFVVLNVGRSWLVSAPLALSLDALMGTFVTGNLVVEDNMKSAVFPILVPIGYLLLLSSWLLVVSRKWKYAVQIAWLILFLSVILLQAIGMRFGYLELLSVGLLGATLGYVPIERIHASLGQPLLVLLGYLCYLVAISFWGEVYLLQVVGVCLSLSLIYQLYRGDGAEPGGVAQLIILLGKYSLLAYIGQIAILQMLRSGVRHLSLPDSMAVIVLLLAVVLVALMVSIVDRMRVRVRTVERLYATVFG